MVGDERAARQDLPRTRRAFAAKETKMPRQRPPVADAYEEWLKRQPATPSTRGQKDRVEADVYEAWLRRRVERRRSRR